MILLFFAVPEEAKPFVREWKRVTGVPIRTVPGPGVAAWASEGLCVHVTGMGPRNAGRVGAAVLESGPPPSAMITAGFAGGLDPDLRCGEVLMEVDPAFPLRSALGSGGVRPGRFHEATRVAVTSAEKAGLRASTGCDAVEMESSTLRALARQRGIPGATVRVISDAAGDTLPLDFNVLMTADDRLDFVRLAGTILRSPGTIPRLMAFQRTVGVAAGRLAEVLVKGIAKRQ